MRIYIEIEREFVFVILGINLFDEGPIINLVVKSPQSISIGEK